MLRGEFIRGDGLVLPNNITQFGARTILNAAMANIDTEFWVGLVDAVPSPTLKIQDVTEPTIGTNGYGRIEIARSAVGWPTVGLVNGERYIESAWLTWEATGGPFDETVRRMMLVTSESATTGDVFALSNVMPASLVVDTDTPEADRKFKYRIYLR